MLSENKINLSFRASKKEYESIKQFSDFLGMSIANFLRQSALREIEDFEDIKDADRILDKNEKKYSWEEAWEKLGA